MLRVSIFHLVQILCRNLCRHKLTVQELRRSDELYVDDDGDGNDDSGATTLVDNSFSRHHLKLNHVSAEETHSPA